MIPKTGNKAADTIIAFALVILVVYVLKRVINLIRSVTPDEDTTKPERDPNVNPLPVDKTKLTYPESQYDLFADELDALFTSSVTEDEAAIKNVFYNLRTDSDFGGFPLNTDSKYANFIHNKFFG